MEACVLAIPVPVLLGEATLEGDRARSGNPRVPTRCGIADGRASCELRSRGYGAPQILAGEDYMADVTLEDAIIHYEAIGSGFPLLLLHGIGSNSRSWRQQLAGLSSEFTVIAWDAPGYGQSSDPVG